MLSEEDVNRIADAVFERLKPAKIKTWWPLEYEWRRPLWPDNEENWTHNPPQDRRSDAQAD